MLFPQNFHNPFASLVDPLVHLFTIQIGKCCDFGITDASQIWIVLVWQRSVCCIFHLLVVLREERLVDFDRRWLQRNASNKFLSNISAES